MENKITGVITRAGEQQLMAVHLENSLEEFQEIVGGYIEVLGIGNNIVIVLNEMGKIDELEPNLALTSEGEIFEVIVGNIVFCSVDEEGEFTSLDEEQLTYLYKNVKCTETQHGIIKVLEVG